MNPTKALAYTPFDIMVDQRTRALDRLNVWTCSMCKII